MEHDDESLVVNEQKTPEDDVVVKNEEPMPTFKIMRRNNNEDVVKESSSAKNIIKEDLFDTGIRRNMTIEEREAAYQRARERIFAGLENDEQLDDCSSSAQVAKEDLKSSSLIQPTTPTASLVSNTRATSPARSVASSITSTSSRFSSLATGITRGRQANNTFSSLSTDKTVRIVLAEVDDDRTENSTVAESSRGYSPARSVASSTKTASTTSSRRRRGNRGGKKKNKSTAVATTLEHSESEIDGQLESIVDRKESEQLELEIEKLEAAMNQEKEDKIVLPTGPAASALHGVHSSHSHAESPGFSANVSGTTVKSTPIPAVYSVPHPMYGNVPCVWDGRGWIASQNQTMVSNPYSSMPVTYSNMSYPMPVSTAAPATFPYPTNWSNMLHGWIPRQGSNPVHTEALWPSSSQTMMNQFGLSSNIPTYVSSVMQQTVPNPQKEYSNDKAFSGNEINISRIANVNQIQADRRCSFKNNVENDQLRKASDKNEKNDSQPSAKTLQRPINSSVTSWAAFQTAAACTSRSQIAIPVSSDAILSDSRMTSATNRSVYSSSDIPHVSSPFPTFPAMPVTLNTFNEQAQSSFDGSRYRSSKPIRELFDPNAPKQHRKNERTHSGNLIIRNVSSDNATARQYDGRLMKDDDNQKTSIPRTISQPMSMTKSISTPASSTNLSDARHQNLGNNLLFSYTNRVYEGVRANHRKLFIFNTATNLNLQSLNYRNIFWKLYQ